MYYEINVSLNGQHFFATAERSITEEAKAKLVLGIFRNVFPETAGYKISCTFWRKEGRRMLDW